MRPSVAAAAALVVPLALLVATMSSAAAQPGASAPIAPPSMAEGPPAPLAPLPKARPGVHRPAVAFFLSLGASVGLLVAAENGAFDDRPELVFPAVTLAPAVGRWYIGEYGGIGMAMRLGGVGLLAIGAESDGENVGAIVTGVTLVFVGMGYDMFGAAITADRQNKRRWAAMPTAVTSPGGGLSPGLAFGGSF